MVRPGACRRSLTRPSGGPASETSASSTLRIRFDLPPHVDRLEDAAAYALLLEVVCGLRSPLAGETQVMGQFKAFVKEVGPGDDQVRRLAQRVLTDAREIRTEHLQGLGARAYGSQVTRHIRGCRVVALIGAGALATEIRPALADVAEVHQWNRATLAALSCGPGSDEPACLVVAAPVEGSVVASVAARYPRLTGIVDLRGEPDAKLPPLGVEVVRLPDLFRAAQQATERAAVRIAAARHDILQRSQAHAHRDELHPFGWDDLCA